jgi:hypothetical protein
MCRDLSHGPDREILECHAEQIGEHEFRDILRIKPLAEKPQPVARTIGAPTMSPTTQPLPQ